MTLFMFSSLLQPNNATVMLWFYGGGFLFGSGSDYDYEGTPLVAFNDVVFVNFNYRVNSFGFLTTGESRLTGGMFLLQVFLYLYFLSTFPYLQSWNKLT